MKLKVLENRKIRLKRFVLELKKDKLINFKKLNDEISEFLLKNELVEKIKVGRPKK